MQFLRLAGCTFLNVTHLHTSLDVRITWYALGAVDINSLAGQVILYNNTNNIQVDIHFTEITLNL